MYRRVAFVTIGQSPRSDVVLDIIAETRTKLVVTECGALDGLDDVASARWAGGTRSIISRKGWHMAPALGSCWGGAT